MSGYCPGGLCLLGTVGQPGVPSRHSANRVDGVCLVGTVGFCGRIFLLPIIRFTHFRLQRLVKQLFDTLHIYSGAELYIDR